MINVIEITSDKNEHVKELKLLSRKKYRESSQTYIIEGIHLVEEAIQANIPIKELIICKSKSSSFETVIHQVIDAELYVLSDSVFNNLSDVPTPQGIMAVLEIRQESFPINASGAYLLLDSVQDPGNVGTMIRTAAAADFQGVVLGDGCADLYSPKVVRSMQGMQFHISIYRENLSSCINKMLPNHFSVYGTALNQSAKDFRMVDFSNNFGLVMGSEGQGVSEEILAMCTDTIYIPISEKVESLNVAVAAGILMFMTK